MYQQKQKDWSTKECYVRCLAIYLLQHKVTPLLQNVSSEERSKQNICELFQENVCKINIKSTTSFAKIAKQSAQKLENWCTTLMRDNFNN